MMWLSPYRVRGAPARDDSPGANVGAEEKRLVEASKGEPMRRLEKKALTLSRLDVL